MLIILYVGFVLWITVLSRDSVPQPEVSYKPFHSLKNWVYYTKLYGIANNFNGNILLFIPLGILLPFTCTRCDKWYRVILVGFCLSLIIETIQLITGRGYFDIDDLILNSVGTLLGWSLWRAGLKIREKRKQS